ncbi:hypothetical protein DRN94_003895 [archaeon]|nr:hypothetical protein [archaeon]
MPTVHVPERTNGSKREECNTPPPRYRLEDLYSIAAQYASIIDAMIREIHATRRREART